MNPVVKRIFALTAAALVLVMGLFTSFNHDLLQAILSSEQVGRYEMARIRETRSHEERGMTINGVRFPLPDGAAEFNSTAYPVPEGHTMFLARHSAWVHYLENQLPPDFLVYDQMGSLYFIRHAHSPLEIHIQVSMYTRHWVRILVS